MHVFANHLFQYKHLGMLVAQKAWESVRLSTCRSGCSMCVPLSKAFWWGVGKSPYLQASRLGWYSLCVCAQHCSHSPQTKSQLQLKVCGRSCQGPKAFTAIRVSKELLCFPAIESCSGLLVHHMLQQTSSKSPYTPSGHDLSGATVLAAMPLIGTCRSHHNLCLPATLTVKAQEHPGFGSS